MRHALAIATLALTLVGCSSTLSTPACESADEPLATAGGAVLTCGEAEVVEQYVEALGARPVTPADDLQIRAAVRARFQADPDATREQLAAAEAFVAALETRSGLQAAEYRTTEVYAAVHRQGALGASEDGLDGALARTVAPWSTDDVEKLVLTEIDIEGWIFYASLCREAQGGGPLRLSVADRVTIYRMVQDRYAGLDREGKIAMAGLGAFWMGTKSAWAAAPYEKQQEWIATAPLPPPMTATGLGYLEAVVSGDPVHHAGALHTVLGPLRIAVVR